MAVRKQFGVKYSTILAVDRVAMKSGTVYYRLFFEAYSGLWQLNHSAMPVNLPVPTAAACARQYYATMYVVQRRAACSLQCAHLCQVVSRG